MNRTMDGTSASDDRFGLGAVVLHYRRVEETQDCLTSLVNGSVVPSRIIVVNNDADEAISQRLRREFPGIEIRTPRENLGFGAGMNLGMGPLIDDSDIDFILCLNNDVVLSETCLEELCGAFRNTNRVAGVCPTVKDDNGSIISQGAFALPFIGLSVPHRGGWGGKRNTTEVPLLDGCCMLFSTEALTDVGGFDSSYFANVEDIDLCTRMRSAGWNLLHVSGAQAIHGVSSSKGGSHSELNVRLSSRNWLLYIKKFFPAIVVALVLPFYLVGRTALVSAWVAKSGEINLLRGHFRGLIEGLGNEGSGFAE